MDIPGNLIHHPVKPDGVFERWLRLVLAGNLGLHPDELDGGHCLISRYSSFARWGPFRSRQTAVVLVNRSLDRYVRLSARPGLADREKTHDPSPRGYMLPPLPRLDF